MTRHYDVIVVGGRLSATICAALLAKRGLRTFLVDQGELASLEGRGLHDLLPSPGGCAVMERVHEELGLGLKNEPRVRPMKPALQVILPDQRFELEPTQEALFAALTRERSGYLDDTASALERLQARAEKVGAFLGDAKELPAHGFFQKRAASVQLKRHEASGVRLLQDDLIEGTPTELRQALLGLLPFITHLDLSDPNAYTAAQIARPLQRWLRGVAQLDVKGGLRGLFLEAAERGAFDVHSGAVAQIQVSGKQVSLELAQGRQTVTADALIDASTDLSGVDTLPAKQQKKDLALTLQAAKPKGRLHVMAVEVDAKVIPPGMGHYLLLLNGRNGPKRADEANASFQDLPIFVVRRSTEAAEREELVMAHPVSAVRAHEEGLDHLEAAMQARLQRLVPFMADGDPKVHTLSGRGATKDHRAVLAHPLFDPDLDPAMGLTGVPMRTPFKNLFVAGPAVLPGLGVEGEYWSALQAVDAACVVKLGTKPKKRLLA